MQLFEEVAQSSKPTHSLSLFDTWDSGSARCTASSHSSYSSISRVNHELQPSMVCLRESLRLFLATPAPTLMKPSPGVNSPIDWKLHISKLIPPVLSLSVPFSFHSSTLLRSPHCCHLIQTVIKESQRYSHLQAITNSCPSSDVPAPYGITYTISTVVGISSPSLFTSQQHRRKISWISSTVEGYSTASGGDTGWWDSPCPCESKSYLLRLIFILGWLCCRSPAVALLHICKFNRRRRAKRTSLQWASDCLL